MLTEILKTWMEIFTLKGGAIGGIQKPTTIRTFRHIKATKCFLKLHGLIVSSSLVRLNMCIYNA